MPVNKKAVRFSYFLLFKQMETETDALLSQMEIERDKLILSGVSKKAAETEIINTVVSGERFARVWSNKQDRIINELSKRFVAVPVQEIGNADKDQLFEWVLGEVKTSHCPDCLRLSEMEPRTLEEWRDLGYGLPREGFTACNIGCQCMLNPVDS